MRKLENLTKTKHLIKEYVEKMNLDLTDKVVLTEIASGPFFVTPFIALAANAKKVIAVTRSTSYGSSDEIIEYGNFLNENFGFSGEIVLTAGPAESFASEADIVTNLGHVRPICESFCEKLPANAVISLMWEPWELREEDIDFNFCKKNEIPVLGVNERIDQMRIFDFVGLLAVKLLFERSLELYGQRILLVGGFIFGEKIKEYLEKIGAIVSHIDPSKDENVSINDEQFHAVVLAEHHVKTLLVGEEGILGKSFFEKNVSAELIHICGLMDYDFLDTYNISKYPEKRVGWGYMTVSTDYLGVLPVVKLHCGGLKVAQFAHDILVKEQKPKNALYEEMKACEFYSEIPLMVSKE